jgi:hypothetical protein
VIAIELAVGECDLAIDDMEQPRNNVGGHRTRPVSRLPQVLLLF